MLPQRNFSVFFNVQEPAVSYSVRFLNTY